MQLKCSLAQAFILSMQQIMSLAYGLHEHSQGPGNALRSGLQGVGRHKCCLSRQLLIRDRGACTVWWGKCAETVHCAFLQQSLGPL